MFHAAISLWDKTHRHTACRNALARYPLHAWSPCPQRPHLGAWSLVPMRGKAKAGAGRSAAFLMV
eukprot:3302790-Prymnesium_polylepis.1